MSRIKVEYDVYSTRFFIDRALAKLAKLPLLSFDTETRGVYPQEERQAATDFLKLSDTSIEDRRLALLVSANSGLSFPSLVNVTHFVFGTAVDQSIVLVCDNPSLEKHIWRWVKAYRGKLLIHNTLYDLKLMFHRMKDLPGDYEDTQLLAKCLINHVNVWKASTRLKDLMAQYYDPKWLEIEGYEPDNLLDPKFLRYAAIDGAATFKLWLDLQQFLIEHFGKDDIPDFGGGEFDDSRNGGEVPKGTS